MHNLLTITRLYILHLFGDTWIIFVYVSIGFASSCHKHIHIHNLLTTSRLYILHLFKCTVQLFAKIIYQAFNCRHLKMFSPKVTVISCLHDFTFERSSLHCELFCNYHKVLVLKSCTTLYTYIPYMTHI
jgi:hypothetical protein